MEITINYWAVIVCSVISMGLGFLWYGPLFGKAWMKSIGLNPNMSEAEIKKMQSQAGPGYMVMIVGSVALALTLNWIMQEVGVNSLFEALKTGVMLWLGFIGIMSMSVVFFEKRPWAYYLINRGYDLVNILVFASVLILWQ